MPVRNSTEQDYHERMLRVLVHIQTHLDEPLRLDDLARVARFSPYHFHRIFKGMMGESVGEHVRRLRLERAAWRLKGSDRPVTTLAFESGYQTHESFTRAFHEAFGVSPSDFRTLSRSAALAAPSGVHFEPDRQPEHIESTTKGAPTMDVKLENLKPMRVAFVRHVGPYSDVGATWMRMMNWAGQRGLIGPASQMIGLCHDDPNVTPPDKLRYDACVNVGPDVKPEGEVGVQEIDGGEYAVATHSGPYERLGDTYAALCGRWLPTSGREARSAPPFEVYRNSPMNTAPENLVTDIYLPLEAR